ncbi:MAG: FAD:protein FMN transferase [Flavobacteriaceae bacterium]|nr:FAD:protein FMN transferase [Flavobacteriaceae bacterium]
MRLTLMDFKRFSSLLLMTLFLSCQTMEEKQTQRIQGYALGTSYSISYSAPQLPETYLERQVDSIFEVLNQSLSTYLPTSDISKINQGDSLLKIDSHFVKVYQKASEVWEASQGYFDPTVGALVNAYGFGPGKPLKQISAQQRDSILSFTGWDKTSLTDQGTIKKEHPKVYFDFNALAKGYVVDVIADFLRLEKVSSFLVEIGGEIVAQGKSPKSNALWKVAIDDPQQGEERKLIQVIALDNQALATSGNYRKYSIQEETGARWVHSINPKTGEANPSSILSVSVLAPDCMTADAYATALMVMPFGQSKALISDHPELEAYWILADSLGGVKEVFSKGFQKK